MKKNSGIELMRIVAVILIVFTHTRNELDKGTAYFIIEKLPTYGTAILSIISGYLYYKVSQKKENLIKRKIKSLAIPYLIANISVLLLVLLLYYAFGYNALNRLSFDFSIITEGVFALNEPPINPPTYFIRDIFVIFLIIALFTQKEFKALIILIPLALFGTLILRLDVAFLFLIGLLYAKFKDKLKPIIIIPPALVITLIVGLWFGEYLKFPVAFLIFFPFVDLQFKFLNVGRYSYLLHLYHSPVIVAASPILSIFIENPLLHIVAQIITALSAVYLFFLLTKRYKFLLVLSGGR